MKQFCQLTAKLAMLVVMLVTFVPAADLPETAFDETDTPVNIGIPQTPIRNELAPVSPASHLPAHNWIQPSTKPEREQFAESPRHPSARTALALFCTLLC